MKLIPVVNTWYDKQGQKWVLVTFKDENEVAVMPSPKPEPRRAQSRS